MMRSSKNSSGSKIHNVITISIHAAMTCIRTKSATPEKCGANRKDWNISQTRFRKKLVTIIAVIFL